MAEGAHRLTIGSFRARGLLFLTQTSGVGTPLIKPSSPTPGFQMILTEVITIMVP